MYRKPGDDFPDQSQIDQSQTHQGPGVRVEQAGVCLTEKPVARRKLALGKRTLIAGAAVIAIVAGGSFATHWWITGRYMISTDDAYVRAHNTTLASKISGYVASIPIEDNTPVHAGDVIATIDDGDYKLAADAAREKVATEQATVDRIGRQVVAQQAAVAQSRAQMVSAQADAKKTQLEFERQQALASQKYASQQQFEQAEAARDQAAAAVLSAQAMIDAAIANLEVFKAQQQEAARTLNELQTAQAKAERDLSFAVIRAPVDGVFSNRAVQTGDYVQTGQRVASLVPLGEVYVEANFKETQLQRLRPGQPVSISVDALPEHAIHGRVASLAPASGAVFSLLPPDNATGNFTKIVQRLPVRIEVPEGVVAERMLRPGMSVVVDVDTKPGYVTEANAASPAAPQIAMNHR
ncbi:MAG TPA: HlyD family secretion protein [Xanthobacteraceae bacterium]|jgi:membrane fusion protein (multidrug efflux system)|nr:HlyD family secretion protein [Xanthobacteraceae bacterium]